MSVSGFIPAVPQGQLNRVITSVIVTDQPQLSVTSSFMAKGQAELSFDEAAVDQIGSATGIINSPKPYVMAKLVVNLLRTQNVAGLYVAQWQFNAVLGSVTAYPDVSGGVFPSFLLSNCSLMEPAPGPYDGQDPTVKITISGIYYVNQNLWASA